jgi:hypothetical protein
LRKFPVVVKKGPELAGWLCDRWVSETADPWFGRRIGAFFSAPEISFPGNGDRSLQRLGSNGQLLDRKPKHLVLAGPLSRQVGEADNADVSAKAFNNVIADGDQLGTLISTLLGLLGPKTPSLHSGLRNRPL